MLSDYYLQLKVKLHFFLHQKLIQNYHFNGFSKIKWKIILTVWIFIESSTNPAYW